MDNYLSGKKFAFPYSSGGHGIPDNVRLYFAPERTFVIMGRTSFLEAGDLTLPFTVRHSSESNG
jgi:hypothetical protein